MKGSLRHESKIRQPCARPWPTCLTSRRTTFAQHPAAGFHRSGKAQMWVQIRREEGSEEEVPGTKGTFDSVRVTQLLEVPQPWSEGSRPHSPPPGAREAVTHEDLLDKLELCHLFQIQPEEIQYRTPKPLRINFQVC